MAALATSQAELVFSEGSDARTVLYRINTATTNDTFDTSTAFRNLVDGFGITVGSGFLNSTVGLSGTTFNLANFTGLTTRDILMLVVVGVGR